MRVKHRQLDVVLREMGNAEQVATLEGRHIDRALLHAPVAVVARVHELHIGAAPMLTAVPSDHERADDGLVSMTEIAMPGLVWFPAHDIPTLRTQMPGAFRSAGHDARVVQEARHTLTVLACVAAGMGWSLLPRSVRALRHDGVRCAEVCDGESLPSFELSAMWLARSRPTFADTVAAVLRP